MACKALVEPVPRRRMADRGTRGGHERADSLVKPTTNQSPPARPTSVSAFRKLRYRGRPHAVVTVGWLRHGPIVLPRAIVIRNFEASGNVLPAFSFQQVTLEQGDYPRSFRWVKVLQNMNCAE